MALEELSVGGGEVEVVVEDALRLVACCLEHHAVAGEIGDAQVKGDATFSKSGEA